MVAIKTVRESNAALKSGTPGLEALFAGATNGIGLSTLRELVKGLNAPRVYIVGRSKEKFSGQLAELELLNANASIEFIEAQISLLKDVDAVCDTALSQERKLDLLYLSPGYLAFGGPDCKQLCAFAFSRSCSTTSTYMCEKIPVKALIHVYPSPITPV